MGSGWFGGLTTNAKMALRSRMSKLLGVLDSGFRPKDENCAHAAIPANPRRSHWDMVDLGSQSGFWPSQGFFRHSGEGQNPESLQELMAGQSTHPAFGKSK
jgi:hypothetical protein